MLQHIAIPRGPIELAADLHLPDHVDDAAPLRTVVLSDDDQQPDEPAGRRPRTRDRD